MSNHEGWEQPRSNPKDEKIAELERTLATYRKEAARSILLERTLEKVFTCCTYWDEMRRCFVISEQALAVHLQPGELAETWNMIVTASKLHPRETQKEGEKPSKG